MPRSTSSIVAATITCCNSGTTRRTANDPRQHQRATDRDAKDAIADAVRSRRRSRGDAVAAGPRDGRSGDAALPRAREGLEAQAARAGRGPRKGSQASDVRSNGECRGGGLPQFSIRSRGSHGRAVAGRDGADQRRRRGRPRQAPRHQSEQGREHERVPKEGAISELHFWDRGFELLKKSGAVIQETEGKHKDCWVMKLEGTADFEGMDEPDKILVRSNGTVTYTGKDIAYQLWKFGLLDRTFNYRKFKTYPDGRILWESTASQRSPDAPKFGGAQKVFNVIDVRQAYLQRVVREGLRLLGHQREAENSIHFSYEMVALTPATAEALGFEVSDADRERPFLEMSGRKGVGVKIDDLLDAVERKTIDAVAQIW